LNCNILSIVKVPKKQHFTAEEQQARWAAEHENLLARQTWGQLLSNVIDYITITLQFS
jgi:hypothetical protein